MTPAVRPDANALQRRAASGRLAFQKTWEDDRFLIVLGSVSTFLILALVLIPAGGLIAGGAGALTALGVLLGTPLVGLALTRHQILEDAPRETENTGMRLRDLRRELRALNKCSTLPKKERNLTLHTAAGAITEGERLLSEATATYVRAGKQYSLLRRIGETLEIRVSTLVGNDHVRNSYQRTHWDSYYTPQCQRREITAANLTDNERGKLAELGMTPEALEDLIHSYQRRSDAVSKCLDRIAEIEKDVRRVIQIQTARDQQARLARTLDLHEDAALPDATYLLSTAGEELRNHLTGLEEVAQIEAGANKRNRALEA